MHSISGQDQGINELYKFVLLQSASLSLTLKLMRSVKVVSNINLVTIYKISATDKILEMLETNKEYVL